MYRDIELRLVPERMTEPDALREEAAAVLRIAPARLRGVVVLRRSLDARPRRPAFQLRVRGWGAEPPEPPVLPELRRRDVSSARPAVIVGAGPAGLFAALRLIEGGIRPVVLERGKDVRARRFDIARLSRDGIVDPDSNYCFGEGG